VPGQSGRIGITFYPRKVDPMSPSGGWKRDLDTDLDAIEARPHHANTGPHLYSRKA
jgi:hypothetical protein